MRKRSAAIACAISGAIVFFSACANLPWGAAPSNPDRVDITDDFKNGDTRLECQLRCALTWGLQRDRVKGLYDTRAWRDVALEVLRIGYGDDLSYFYLGKAAEGIGYYHAAEIYYRLSRTATLKCSDIYGYCYGFVFARDARPSAPAVAKKAAENQTETAEWKPPAGPPALVDRQRPETEKRSNAAQPKKHPAEKPIQQAEASKPRAAPKAEPPVEPVAEKKIPEAESKLAASVTFEEISEKFGPQSRLTEAQKREEWKRYQGRCVEWNGELSYVGDGFIRGLTLGFKQNPQTLTYDVLVSTPDDARDAALRMKKGGRYAYRATLKKYGGPILPISVDWGCRPPRAAHVKTD